MFRRTRILQAVLLTLLTTACASRPTAEIQHGAPAAGAPTQAGPAAGAGGTGPQVGAMIATPTSADLAEPSALPEIQAGRSETGSRAFTRADGTLEPDIEAFADEVARLRQVPLQHVRALLLDAQFNATAARLMAPVFATVRK